MWFYIEKHITPIAYFPDVSTEANKLEFILIQSKCLIIVRKMVSL